MRRSAAAGFPAVMMHIRKSARPGTGRPVTWRCGRRARETGPGGSSPVVLPWPSCIIRSVLELLSSRPRRSRFSFFPDIEASYSAPSRADRSAIGNVCKRGVENVSPAAHPPISHTLSGRSDRAVEPAKPRQRRSEAIGWPTNLAQVWRFEAPGLFRRCGAGTLFADGSHFYE